MTAYEIIQKKQRGEELSREELSFMLEGMLRETVPDYQIAALLMAIYFQGMTPVETYSLTDLMLHSGEVIELNHLDAPRADKHSTGGVGDKVTLILAPLLAAGGVAVPMISGRGLGHTGGTLDKLEAIRGFSTSHTPEQFRRQVEEIGLCITSQSDRLVPADRRLYALRDVTATVDSVPLITGSIMSKKLAEGIDTLLLDVKVGSGAIFRTQPEALALTHNLLSIGQQAGINCAALLTQMEQPLGFTIGNWNEVAESARALQGDWPQDLREVTLAQAAVIFQQTGLEPDLAAGIARAQRLIEDGSALAKFAELVAVQGGDAETLQDPDTHWQPAFCQELKATQSGVIERLDAREFGLAAVALGAGRRQLTDQLDNSAGITLRIKAGDTVQAGEVIATFYADREPSPQVAARLQAAVTISDTAAALPVIQLLVTSDSELDWRAALQS